MIKMTLQITLDGDAFDGDKAGPEITRILMAYAEINEGRTLEPFEQYHKNSGYDVLRDINGNRCGLVTFTGEEE